MSGINKLIEKEKLLRKQVLISACVATIENRINNAKHAMEQSQASANNEGKSSAGDKHETARAMSQINRDMYAKQLEESLRDLQYINTLSSNIKLFDKVCTGAVVVCKEYSFYIALGLGSIMLEGHKIIFLSPNAPIARLLYHRIAKDTFDFNGIQTEILDVF